MRGKTRATTRYTGFRNKMINTFCSEEGKMSEFIAFIRAHENIDWAIALYCDEEDNLLFMESNPVTVIYQILRLIDKPVLLRQIEPLSEFIWEDKGGKVSLYTAICVLYSVNLIDYSIRDFESSPSNILQLFVREDV